MALITSDCSEYKIPDHQMALTTSDCVPSEGVFEPGEMQSLGHLLSSLADQEVGRIEREAAAGRVAIGGLDGVKTNADYLAYQAANPDTWQDTVSTMATVQVMPGGGLLARKLNHPIKSHGGAFRTVAMDPRLTSLASALLGGRPAMVFSDQAFLKPPGGGGPKPFHQVGCPCDERAALNFR